MIYRPASYRLKTLPAIGYTAYKAYGSGFPSRMDNTTNETVVTKRRKLNPRGKRNSFKQRLLKNIPAKHKTTNDSQTTIAMTHNTINTCNLSAGIVQGTADGNRIGDTVHLLAVKINALYTSPAASTASVQLRLIIGYAQPEYNLPNTFGAGLTLTEIFQTGTGANWTNTAIINPKAFTVLDDRLVTINNNITNISEIQELVYTVQADTEFPFKANASLYGKTRNLYFVAIGCVNAGVAGVTAAGQVNISTDLIFKDK